MSAEEVEGRRIYELTDYQWDLAQLRGLFEDILPQSPCFNGYEMLHEFAAVGTKMLLLNAGRIYREP